MLKKNSTMHGTIEKNSLQNIGVNNTVTMDIKKRLANGAFWFLLLAAFSAPLAFYRNWMLGQIGEGGIVVGIYALLLVVVDIVSSFFLVGGSSVIITSLLKIRQDNDKSAFIYTYSRICLTVTSLVFLAAYLWPGLIDLITTKPIATLDLYIVLLLVPVALFAQISNFSLTGLGRYKLSAILSQVQLLFVVLISAVGLYLFKETMTLSAMPILASTMSFAYIVMAWVGFREIFNSLSGIDFRVNLPRGFWRFTAYVHINTIVEFSYRSVDQLIIASVLGLKELGAYFVFLQCAELIRFIPQRIAQVVLSSFTELSNGHNSPLLRNSYYAICRLVLLVSTPLALLLVLFSKIIGGFFGDWSEAKHGYLIFLALGVNIGSLSNINGMLVLAKEKSDYFFVNSLIIACLQIIITLLLLESHGVYGVIAGKIVGMAAFQLGMFLILRYKISDLRIDLPKEYWASQFVVICAVAISIIVDSLSFLLSLVTMVLLFSVYLLMTRLKYNEIINLLRQLNMGGLNKVAMKDNG
jgi:O-antigen/teichoic acid export membrane protein